MKILVLTTFYDEKNITLAMQYGANGYLLKDSGRNAILAALLNIRNGQSVIDQKVLDTITKLISDKNPPKISNTIGTLANLESPQVFTLSLAELTKREQEICSMIAEGFTNAQIKINKMVKTMTPVMVFYDYHYSKYFLLYYMIVLIK